ncbi:hypothetical protein EC3234A_105c00010 [Escherichia coli]|nr:hypothetical protein EC3234A_105c00010 [Escherichia coli]
MSPLPYFFHRTVADEFLNAVKAGDFSQRHGCTGLPAGLIQTGEAASCVAPATGGCNTGVIIRQRFVHAVSVTHQRATTPALQPGLRISEGPSGLRVKTDDRRAASFSADVSPQPAGAGFTAFPGIKEPQGRFICMNDIPCQKLVA